MSAEEPFLARWSRLKRGEREERPGEVAEPGNVDAAAPEAQPGSEQPEPFDPASLPRLEDLTAETDIRAFLDPRVPAELQSQALRRAWRLDPVIDTFIEVAENQYDWNTPGGAPGYGPLDAGPDLPQLLAQATGRLLAPTPAPETVAVEGDTPSTSAELPAVATVSLAAPHMPPDHTVETATGETRSQHPAASAESPCLSQRRHGSALPR